MSQAHQESEPMIGHLPTIEDLAWAQHAEPADSGELAPDIWEPDAELETFLADMPASRNTVLSPCCKVRGPSAGSSTGDPLGEATARRA